MDQTTKQSVVENSNEIFRYFKTKTFPEYLDKNKWGSTVFIFRSLEILECIQQQPLTAYEAGYLLDLSPQTIFQYIGAMIEGGIPINKEPGPVLARTGRPETVFSIEEPQ